MEYSLIARSIGPTWGPPGSCRPHMGPMLAPWTLLSGFWPLRHEQWDILQTAFWNAFSWKKIMYLIQISLQFIARVTLSKHWYKKFGGEQTTNHCKHYWWSNHWRIYYDDVMTTLSVLLALCEGNPPVTEVFPSQRVSDAVFDIFINVRHCYTNSWVAGDFTCHDAFITSL